MSVILLGRHAESTANKRDPAFGNQYAPLTRVGVTQALNMERQFEEQYGVVPSDYERPVLASKLLRTQSTAQYAGFLTIDSTNIINEGLLPPGMLRGRQIVQKHADELWVPDELKARADIFLSHIQTGKLDYEIVFTHGLFIAAVMIACENKDLVPDPERGYIPRLATITPIQI